MIIGRKREQKKLEQAYSSEKSQFITIYGRRRIGKTYLIDEFFKKKKCHFFHSMGLQHGSTSDQLESFTTGLSETFFRGRLLQKPSNWKEAFAMLHNEVLEADGKVVIFLDELPWLATRKSGLMTQIDFYWNRYWSKMPKVIFIVCGSSASWLIQKIIYNKGGLHNRTTLEIELRPFSLQETRQYLIYRKIQLSDKQIVALYMAIGGIPYYLDYVEPGLTPQQTIQRLFFNYDSPLKHEFDKLFDSLFDGADAYKELVSIIAKRREGIGRSEIELMTKLSSGGGHLTKRLKDLCLTGFIKEFVPWGKTRGEYYKVIDEFTLFFTQWLMPYTQTPFVEDHWIIKSQRPEYYAWAGYAFEAICYKHIYQIVRAFKIQAINPIGSWRFIPRNNIEKGAQIDLIIDRIDNALTLAEIKYSDKPFILDKQYAAVLNQKREVFKKQAKPHKDLFLALVAANGLKKTIYSEDIISGIATIEDLFKELD